MIDVVRAALVSDLVSGSDGAVTPIGVTVLDAWPSKAPTPPVAFVVPPQGTYVSAGPTFGTYTVALDVVLVAGRPEARDALVQLDQLIERVLVNTADWTLAGVDSPAVVTINGVDYLGCITHLSKPAQI
jgi:hypothetical protein